MKTRIGKIAQLPKLIRDDLNHRLANGKQAPELLCWLNSLSETKELIATKFDDHPISPQNLTEWRHGGYQEWLHHQEREQRIQRLAEEGTDLKNHEGDDDLFENTARIALAELVADLDELHQLKGEARWERLRFLTRELTRLQSSFNRSRWAALAWTRWNDRFLGPDDYEPEIQSPKLETAEPRSAECHSAVSPTGSRQPLALAERAETPISDLPSSNSLHPTPVEAEIIPNQTKSTVGEGNNGTPPCSHPRAEQPTEPETSNLIPARPSVSPISPIRPLSPLPERSISTDSPNSPASPLTPRPSHLTPSLDPHADFRRKMAHLKSLQTSALPLDTHPLTFDTKRAK